MNPKATNKKTKQRILAKKPTKEIRWTKKITQKEAEKEVKGNKEHMGLTENSNKMINLTIYR